MTNIAVGDIVRAHYNSGTYIGEVKEDRGKNYLIEVLGVVKHPLQGDLHNPGKVDGVFFHERKALAFHEKANIKKPAVKPYDEEIPAYSESLKKAVSEYKEKLKTEDTPFNEAALKALNNLEETVYSKGYY